MSTYANIFIRINDTFVPIADYSRNSVLGCKLIEKMPYEKIKVLDYETLNNILKDVQEEIKKYKTDIVVNEHKRDIIMGSCSNFSERNDTLEYYDEINNEIKQYIDECTYTENSLIFLMNMYDQIRYTDNEYIPQGINRNKYMYCGIEIAYPTIEDVEE